MRKSIQKKRTLKGMGYREVQRLNSVNRNNLSTTEKQWLKDHRYRNIGWDNVINLYNKIKDFSHTLEELFLEADRIGNKYQTNQEINDFNQRLAKEVNEIAEEIDKQFPETKIEVIDYSTKKSRRYNTVKMK